MQNFEDKLFCGTFDLRSILTWSRSGNISASPHSPSLPCLSSNQVAPDVTVLGSTDKPTLNRNDCRMNSMFFSLYLFIFYLGKRSLAALASESTATAVTQMLRTSEPKW